MSRYSDDGRTAWNNGRHVEVGRSVFMSSAPHMDVVSIRGHLADVSDQPPRSGIGTTPAHKRAC